MMTFDFSLSGRFPRDYSRFYWVSKRRSLGDCQISVFTGQMPFLSPNQQCQSTEAVQL